MTTYKIRLARNSVFALALCGFVQTGVAEPAVKPLAKGFSAEMVRKTWGPPSDVQEREASRIIVWHYQNGGVVNLAEGKVISFDMPKGYVPPVETLERTTEYAREENVDASLTRDLVREIASEIPSSPDSPLSGISADVPAETAPPIVQPVQPFPGQQNQGVFQGVPNQQQRGSFYVPEDDELD